MCFDFVLERWQPFLLQICSASALALFWLRDGGRRGEGEGGGSGGGRGGREEEEEEDLWEGGGGVIESSFPDTPFRLTARRGRSWKLLPLGQPKHGSLIHPPITTADTPGADWPSPRGEDGPGQQAMQSNPSPIKLLTLSVSVSLCLCLSPSHPSLSLSLSVCMYVCLFVSLSPSPLNLSFCLCHCLSLSVSLSHPPPPPTQTEPIAVQGNATDYRHYLSVRADLTRKLSINNLSRKKADKRAKSCGFADGYFVDAICPGLSLRLSAP